MDGWKRLEDLPYSLLREKILRIDINLVKNLCQLENKCWRRKKKSKQRAKSIMTVKMINQMTNVGKLIMLKWFGKLRKKKILQSKKLQR
jgi:hypothetical protein